MREKVDSLGTLRASCGDEPMRLAAMLGCAFGLARRREGAAAPARSEARALLSFFLDVEKLRVDALSALIVNLSREAPERSVHCIAKLDRECRVWALAGAALGARGADAEEFGAALRQLAQSLGMGSAEIAEAARALGAAGFDFDVVEGDLQDVGGKEHATFVAAAGCFAVAWRRKTQRNNRLRSHYPFGDVAMTPGDYLPTAEPLRQLAARYPWPEQCPTNPFDRRGWFSEPNRQALMQFLPHEPCLILEVGSFLGASLRFMMELRPGSFFIAVDPFSIVLEEANSLEICDFRDNFYANCWNYRDRLIAVPEEYADAFPILKQLGVRPDVAYIDGEHTYAAVKADATRTLELNPDALLIGDDYSDPTSISYGLRAAVTELCRETGRRLHVIGGHVWVLESEPA
jgi:hypothetical protein